MEAVFTWVATYGYAALFALLMLGIIALPVPEETLLVFAGAMVAQGKLDAKYTYIAAVLGAWCGITCSYWIGRKLGFKVALRYGKYFHLDEAKLEAVHQWFERVGHWALFFGYYIAGVRHFTALAAGASLVEFPVFMRFAWPGAMIWAAVFLTLGYYIGDDWRAIAALVERYLFWISIGLGACLAVYLFVRWRRKSQKPAVIETRVGGN